MVSVGRFTPPAPDQINDCLRNFARGYDLSALNPSDRLISLAAAHHRFLYIHPFADGNGRVARLLTEAMANRLGYCGYGLYSISRGLARNHKQYSAALAVADQPQLHAADGRGSLSLAGLVEFCNFFLTNMLDQIEFMLGILERSAINQRFETFIALSLYKKDLTKAEAKVLTYLFKVGEMKRGQIQTIAGVKERQANNITSSLLESRLVESPSPKGRLSIRFNTLLRRTLFEEFFVND